MLSLIVSISLTLASCLHGETAVDKDLALIAERLRQEILNPTRLPNVDDVTQDIANISNDGSWSDIDYDDTSKTHWIPREHLRRILNLARAYRTPEGPLAESDEVRSAFLSGLRYWVERDPQSENWYRQSIGSPESLGDALLLMGDAVPSGLVEATGHLVRRSGFTRTGANLVWEASNLLTWACVTSDDGLLREVVEHIGSEIRVTTEEGIQPDDSFHQHGPQNYLLGYGRSYANSVTGIAVILSGTGFAFPDEKIRILSRLVLDGQQWFAYGRQIDYHAMGREAFRGRPGGRHNWNARSLAYISKNMEASDPERASEFQALAARATGTDAPGSSGPLGNKHFWRSDAMVHRAGNWYASVRFHSTRTYATEIRVNRENLRGYHLSDGVLFLMRRGDEYHDLQPVWDYRKLPGLTARQSPDPLPYGRRVPREGNTNFVGGASDGLAGVAAMDLQKDDVRAKKAYFFTDQGIVCLGSGITGDRPESVMTTLDQNRLASDIHFLRDEVAETLVGGRVEAQDIRAVVHDSVAYVMLESASLVIESGKRDGSWHRVEEKAPDERVPQDVFTCYIDHGANPTDASYAYRMIPGASAADLPGLVNQPSIRVLENTPAIQAVDIQSQGLIQAVFHAQGSLKLGDEDHLTVDAPCVVQLRVEGDNRSLTIADPTQELDQLTVTLTGKLNSPEATYAAAENVTRVVVQLPNGPLAGQSVVLPLQVIQ
jgi:chondroitin AC lyase